VTRVALAWLALVFAIACGDDAPPPDTGDVGAVDAADASPDSGISAVPDAALLPRVEPAAPRAPAPPTIGPCEPGWLDRDVMGVSACAAFDPDVDCAAGEHPLVGEGCATLGAACPADGFPAGLVDGPTVRFVEAGAPGGGSGSRTSPFATINQALAGAPRGTTIAIATGTYAESLVVPGGVTLRGACTAQTRLEGSAGSAAIRVTGDGVTLAELSVSGDGRGIELIDVGADVTLASVAILGVRAPALVASSGTSVDVDGFVVRDTRAGAEPAAVLVDGGALMGTRLSVLDGETEGIRARGASAEVSLERAAIARPAESAVVADDGAMVSLRALSVTEGDGGGIVSTAGAAVDVDRAMLERLGGRALDARGGDITATRVAFVAATGEAVGVEEGAEVSVTDAALAGTAGDPSGGRGANVRTGAVLTLERVSVFDTRETGLRASGLTSRMTLTDVRVEGVLPDVSRGDRGRCIAATGGATVMATSVSLSQCTEAGVWLADAETSLFATDLVIADVTTDAAGSFGRAIDAGPGTRVDLTRGDLSLSADTGLFAYAAMIRVEDVRVRDSLGDGTGRFGRGVSMVGGTLDAARLRVTNNRDVGLYASDGAVITLMDSTLDGTRGRASDDRFGRDLVAVGGASVDARGVSFFDARDISVFVTGTGTELVGSAVSIASAVGRDSDGEMGRGINVQGGASVELEGLYVSGARELGVAAFEEGSRIELTEVVVEGTQRLACEGEPECSGESAGIALGVYAGAYATATRFVFSDNALLGIQLATGETLDGPATIGGTADLADGVIARNAIGANVQVAGFDLTRIRDGVSYLDNDLPYEGDVLPVPGVADSVASD